VAVRRELLFTRRDDVLFFMNNIGYIFIVRRLGKQSNSILSRSDSISTLELNLRIHGPCGPNAHAGADLQVFIFCFKPILLSAHKLILLIYGDNKYTPELIYGNISLASLFFPLKSWLSFQRKCTGYMIRTYMSQAKACTCWV